jgi:hypothetical protein
VAQSSGVILRTVDSGFFNASPKAHPSNIYVVSYRDGRIRSFTGAPSAGDRWGSRYCYIVDTAERRVQKSFSIPTSVDAYSFTAEVEATWKVTDPEAVVRANLSDGNVVVLARLQDELWIVGRQFVPQDVAGAEAAARSALRRVKDLDEGITVLRSTAKFREDRHLSTAVLERDQDTHQGSREERRMLLLRRLVDGSDESVLLMHLMQHPDDTKTVLQIMSDARDRNQTAQFGLLDRLLDHNLITDADAQPLRDRVLGAPSTPPATMRPITSRATPPALPSSTTSPASAAPVSSPPGTQAAAGGTPPAKKVYVVGDADVTGQAPPAAAPDPQPGPDPAAPAGGVKKWKSVKKNPPQGSR